jgi:Flp pilus assembly pilin Flp
MVSQRGCEPAPLRIHSRKHDHPGEGMSMSRGKRVYNLIVTSRGQTMAEYALILATIALVAIALVGNAGTIVNELVNGVSGLLL